MQLQKEVKYSIIQNIPAENKVCNYEEGHCEKDVKSKEMAVKVG